MKNRAVELLHGQQINHQVSLEISARIHGGKASKSGLDHGAESGQDPSTRGAAPRAVRVPPAGPEESVQ